MGVLGKTPRLGAHSLGVAFCAAFSALLCVAIVATPSIAQSQDTALLDSEGEADAAIFVLERYFSDQNDIAEIESLYNETVWYFDLGPQPRAAIMADKSAYIARWPDRDFTPDLSTLKVTHIGGQVYDVSVEVDFTVSNGDRQVEGRTFVKLTVERIGDTFRITEEGGRVLSRQRDGG